jgi:hypothetical protein
MTEIKNNVFQGVVWDGKAIEAINATAQALLNLTKLFNSQGIKINMISVEESSGQQIKDSIEDRKNEEI